MTHEHVLAAISAEPWAITREGFEQVVAIATRVNEEPTAVAARLGRPLDNTHQVANRDGVAVIPITGPIFRYANLFSEISGATSLEVLATDTRTALDDPAIRGIILNIDSPGGQATGIAEYAKMIRDWSMAEKPIVAYIGGMGASAAYWVAAGASEVVVSPTAIVGSIGVVAGGTTRKPDGSYEIVSSQSPRKRPDPATEAGRAQLQKQVDALAQVFIEAVAEYRGTDPQTVIDRFGGGGMVIGKAAVDAGMADRMGSLESMISEMQNRTGGAGPPRRMPFMASSTPVPAPVMTPLTRERLFAEAPDLVQQLQAEATATADIVAKAAVEARYATGLRDGATTERERIQAVLAQTLTGHEDLVKRLAFDGHTTAAEAAVAVLAAERGLRATTLSTLYTGGQTPLPQPPIPGQQANGNTEPTAEALAADVIALYERARRIQPSKGGTRQ